MSAGGLRATESPFVPLLFSRISTLSERGGAHANRIAFY